MIKKERKQAELKIFKRRKSRKHLLEIVGIKAKKKLLPRIGLKIRKGSKYYSKYRKTRKKLRKLLRKKNLITVILVFATLAMLATSILPYIL